MIRAKKPPPFCLELLSKETKEFQYFDLFPRSIPKKLRFTDRSVKKTLKSKQNICMFRRHTKLHIRQYLIIKIRFPISIWVTDIYLWFKGNVYTYILHVYERNHGYEVVCIQNLNIHTYKKFVLNHLKYIKIKVNMKLPS